MDLANNPTYKRLEEQIGWYDSKSGTNQTFFKWIKFFQIVGAAAIPLAATEFKDFPWVTGSVGIALVILEGLQSLNQYQHNWITYRSTCEELKHEKYLFLGKADPYSGMDDDFRLRHLAERVESLVSREHSKWVANIKQEKKADGQNG